MFPLWLKVWKGAVVLFFPERWWAQVWARHGLRRCASDCPFLRDSETLRTGIYALWKQLDLFDRGESETEQWSLPSTNIRVQPVATLELPCFFTCPVFFSFFYIFLFRSEVATSSLALKTRNGFSPRLQDIGVWWVCCMDGRKGYRRGTFRNYITACVLNILSNFVWYIDYFPEENQAVATIYSVISKHQAESYPGGSSLAH